MTVTGRGTLLAGVGLMCALLAPRDTTAQTVVPNARPSPPFIIQAVGVDGTEQVSTGRWPLLAQPVTSLRAVRLDADTPAATRGSVPRVFPAGTKAFGIYIRDGWAYCAVAEATNWFLGSDQFVCYVDSDNDGQFESSMNAGEPFNGVPLLVWGAGELRPLPAPAPYSRIPAAEGPSLEYVIGYEIVRPSGRRARDGRYIASPATYITTSAGFRLPNGVTSSLYGRDIGRRVPLANGQTATIRLNGAEIEILGVNDDNSIRYRIIKTMPSQIQQIDLQDGNLAIRWGEG